MYSDGAMTPWKLATVSARRKRVGSSERGTCNEMYRWFENDGFRYTVAPHEAKAQLVYMERCGLIQSVAACDADYFALGGGSCGGNCSI